MCHPHVPGCMFLSLELLTGDPCGKLQPYSDLIAIMCRIERSGRSCMGVLRVQQEAGRLVQNVVSSASRGKHAVVDAGSVLAVRTSNQRLGACWQM
jgi:hypothetical protein